MTIENKRLTLAFVRREGKILLGYKKRGFGVGRWNGFGGKVEPNETIPQAAKRELEEESGARAENLEHVGIMMFEFINEPQLLEVHVFQTHEFSGNIAESDEMRPQWYNEAEVPFSEMWPDDYLWFPLMLSGKKFYGYFLFDGMDTIVSMTLNEVERLKDVIIPQGPQLSSSGECMKNNSKSNVSLLAPSVECKEDACVTNGLKTSPCSEGPS